MIAATAWANVVIEPLALNWAALSVPFMGLSPATSGRMTPPATPGAPLWMWAATRAPDSPLYSTW